MKANKPLGAFLRSRRLRLDPERFGIRRTRARRTAGLRREELAELAGIGMEWYVKLEQGRAAHPSASTLAALGAVLALDDVEMAHLRALAAGSVRPAFVPERLPEGLRRMVDAYPHPAYITGERWDILAFNDAAGTLFGFGRLDLADRNLLVYMLTDAGRALFGADWLPQVTRIVALFRPAYDRRAGDPAFESLVERLHAACPAFAGWWADHRIDVPAARTKLLHTHGVGAVRYDVASFQALEAPTLRLALYTPQA